MLRKDVKYMLERDWEPKIPEENVICKQSAKFAGRLSGSVRLARGLVATSGSRVSIKKRNRLQRKRMVK